MRIRPILRGTAEPPHPRLLLQAMDRLVRQLPHFQHGLPPELASIPQPPRLASLLHGRYQVQDSVYVRWQERAREYDRC